MLLDRLEIKSFTVVKHLRLLPEQKKKKKKKKKNLPGIEVVHPKSDCGGITFETEINIFMIFDKYDH